MKCRDAAHVIKRYVAGGQSDLIMGLVASASVCVDGCNCGRCDRSKQLLNSGIRSSAAPTPEPFILPKS